MIEDQKSRLKILMIIYTPIYISFFYQVLIPIDMSFSIGVTAIYMFPLASAENNNSTLLNTTNVQ